MLVDLSKDEMKFLTPEGVTEYVRQLKEYGEGLAEGVSPTRVDYAFGKEQEKLPIPDILGPPARD